MARKRSSASSQSASSSSGTSSAGHSGSWSSAPRRSPRMKSLCNIKYTAPMNSGPGDSRNILSIVKKVTKIKNQSTDNVVGRKPPKFSWVLDGLLAGHGRPTDPGHVQYLTDHGIKYLITLTMNKPTALHHYPGVGLQWVHVPIQDETPPSFDQIKHFVSVVDKAKLEGVAVSVHCAWGRGRTGTMLACYVVRYSRLSADEAISMIRKLRPGSIDTEKQINAVKEYAQSINQ